MSGGYGRGRGDGFDGLLERLRSVERRLRELEIPTGTQTASLVAQVQAKLAELTATVNDLVADAMVNFYTKAEADAKIASPGAVTPTTVAASGAVSGGTGTFNGGLKSADVYSRSVTYGGPYTATWTNQDGTMGTAPSSERFKQDVTPAELDLTALERAEVVEYRYRDAVANLGDNAETHLGGIAEQFVAAGLGHTVTIDEDGQPFTIEDRPLLYTLLAYVQQLSARVRELEAK